MPSQTSLMLLTLLVATGVPFYSLWFKPKSELLGFFRNDIDKYPSLNNEKCRKVKELVGCEDQYIHRSLGLSYLPCSPPEARQLFMPPLHHRDAQGYNSLIESASPKPLNWVHLFDLVTEEVIPIEIEGWDGVSEGQRLGVAHGIEAFIPDSTDGSKQKVTFFLNNHHPPSDVSSTSPHFSTIEIFETFLPSSGEFPSENVEKRKGLGKGERGETWKHVKSLKHELIRTPNSIVAVDERKWFFTNDHPNLIITPFQAKLEPFFPGLAEIVFCDASDPDPEKVDCKIVADGVYPNGLTKGPDQTIYLASTMGGYIQHYEIQSDYSLTLLDTIKVPRFLDNIHVTESGAVYASAIAAPSQWSHWVKRIEEGKKEEVFSPTEVWRIGNETGQERFFGDALRVEKVFSDNGKTVGGITNAVPYKGKLYLTGLLGYHLSVCDLPENFDE